MRSNFFLPVGYFLVDIQSDHSFSVYLLTEPHSKQHLLGIAGQGKRHRQTSGKFMTNANDDKKEQTESVRKIKPWAFYSMLDV